MWAGAIYNTLSIDSVFHTEHWALKHPAHLKGQFACHGRCRRWMSYGVAGGLVLVLLVGFYLTRPRRLAGFAQAMLEDVTGADVNIASATLDSNGTLQLHHLTMTLPDNDAASGRLFDVTRVQVTQDLWSLMTGRFRATSVTLIQPTIHITRDPARDTYNFQLLPPKPSDEPPGAPTKLPTIYLREGQLAFATRNDDDTITDIGTVHLSGSLQSKAGASSVYTLQLREDRPQGEEGLLITGQYDLDQQSVFGSMQNFNFDGVVRDALPARVLDVWAQLDPQGSIPLLKFAHSPAQGLSVELHLQDMALRIAQGQVDERLQHTSGKFIFRDSRLTVEELTGQFLGSTLTFNGWLQTNTGRMNNLLAGASCDIELRLANLHIPEDPEPYLATLPAVVRRNFERFDPRGEVNALVRIARDTTGDVPTTRVDGYADLTDVSGRYYRFNYPVNHVRGRVSFSNDAVKLENIHGVGLTGARVVLSGIVAPPGEDALVDITVTVDRVPVDEYMLNALRDDHRKAVEELFDAERYESLRAAGRVQTSAEHQSASEALHAFETANDTASLAVDSDEAKRLQALRDRADVPVFELGGKVDAVAFVKRPLGKNTKYTTTVHVNPAGVGIIYENWKYPVHVTGGKLEIANSVQVHELALKGLSGAEVAVAGVIDNPKDMNVGDTLLTLRTDRMPLDEWVMETLNDAGRTWLTTLQLSAPLALTCRTYINDEQRVDFVVDTTFREGNANPWNSGFELSNVGGKATIRRDTFVLHGLTGDRGDARVSLTGKVKWRDGGDEANITLDGKHLTLEPQLLALAEAIDESAVTLTRLQRDYQVESSFDVQAVYAIKPDGSNARQITLKPHDLHLKIDDVPVKLTDMTGQVRLVGPGIVLDNLTGTLKGGALSAKGQVTWLSEMQIDVALNYDDGKLSPAVRALLPEAAQAVVDGMELAGGVSLRDGNLRVAEHDSGTAIHFDGKVGFKDASASVGLPANRINGTLTVAIARDADEKLPSMKFDLAGDSLHVSNRQVTQLVAAISTTADRQTLQITRLDGEVYGGRLVGSGSMDLVDDHQLQMQLNLQDVTFEPFMAAAKSTKPDDNAEVQDAGDESVPSGVLSAGLTFEAVPGDIASRRGRGSLRVHNAKLYDLPLALGMLQIANLTLPTSRAFDRVQATYLLEGDILTIENVELLASSVALIGAGHVRLSDRKIDLAFVSRNPESPLDLGFLGDLLHGLKDELVGVHLTGTLDEPKIGMDSFRQVRESWQSIFSSQKNATSKD